MARRLAGLGRPWTLHYCARRREQAAFVGELEALASPDRRVLTNFDGAPGGRMLDIAAALAEVPRDSHLYCCGPAPMLAGFEAAAASWPAARVHVEYFAAKDAPAAEGGYVVALAKSGRELAVPPGRSMLEVLLEAGVDVPYSCTQGVCGTCELRVLGGVPDHRDAILSPAEREQGATVMPCCSGSRTPRLVLDL